MSGKTPQQLEEEAIKKTKGFLFFKAGPSDYEQAAELYETAANKYKINRQFIESGKAYEKSANCLELAKSACFEIAGKLLEASKVYKSVSYDDFLRCLERVIQLEIDAPQIHQAALHLKQAAEATLEHGDFETAISHFSRAAEFFSLEDSKSYVTQCNTQLAIIYSLHKNDYPKAAELYENLARVSLESNLTRFNAKEHLFKAGICRLMSKDYPAARDKITLYEGLDPTFTGSLEIKLLNKLVEALEEIDEEGFTNAIAEYDSLHRLDPWKTQMLTKMKVFFSEGAVDLL